MKSRGPSSGSQLKEIVDRASFPQLIVILCPDEIRRRRACEHLLEPHLAKTKSTSAVTRLRGQDVSPAAMRSLSMDLQMGSLFDPVRFWVIDRVDQIKIAEARDLAEAVNKFPKTHHLIALGESLPATHPLRARANEDKTFVDLPELKGAELSRWVERELALAKLETSDPSVVESFVQLGEGRPDLICKQVELASLYCEPGQLLTSNMTRQLFPGRFHPSDYDLLEALTHGDFPKAERLLQSLEIDDRSPYMLSAFLSRCWAQLIEVRQLLDRGFSEADIRARLSLSPWIAAKVVQQSKRLNKEVVMNGLEALLWTDSRLKGRGAGPSSVLSQTAWRLTSASSH